MLAATRCLNVTFLRGFLELPSTGGKQLRNILSDPDPVLDWDITCQFHAPVSFVIPNVVL